MHKLRIGWMYPNLLNLHGERGSIQALVQIGKKMGIDVEVLRVEDFEDAIPFDQLDMLVFLPGEISSFCNIIPALQSQALGLYLEQGGYLLALGTSGLMFGNAILREDGTTLQGLGYLDMTAKERTYVWGDDLQFYINSTKQMMAGSQIQMADVDAKHPLGSTVYGMGNNNTGAEGARWKNLIYTNCLGPLFVKNPWFAESILKDILLQKTIGLQTTVANQIASDAFESTLAFIKRKAK